MKTLLQFVAGLLLIVAALYATPTPLPKIRERDFAICHEDFGCWFRVVWTGSTIEKPYHPNWTAIVTDYKPIVKKLPYDKWEITFTSELTEGIP